MKGFHLLLYILFSGFIVLTTAHAQDSVAHRIILVGDAGFLNNDKKNPELDLIKRMFDLNNKKTTVLFLGDNVYPQGLPSPYASNYLEKKAILDSQINVVRGTNAQAYFMAGNHDWMQGRSGGWEQVINQYRYIQSLQLPNVQYVPFGVCPGPDEIPLSDTITLVVIDSQWWLHKFDKPGIRSGCEIHTEDQLLAALRDIINRNEKKILIFAAHHPFITYGRHGGYFNFKQHIFPFTELKPNLYIPLPVIGSLYPIARGVFGNIQDTRHPIYKNFSSAVDSVLSLHPYCIRVAGHEHNLQLIELKNQFYVVSGSGSKISAISKGEGLKFVASKTGFSVIELNRNGKVYINFYSSTNDSAQKPLSVNALPSLDTTPVKKIVYEPRTFTDSVIIVANRRYKAGSFKRWLLGDNYREEWTEPIKVKVFDIGKEKGVLQPTRRGGGMQTKSLRLKDTSGHEYVLRTIEKFPDNTLPEEFRKTFVRDAVVDGISASYPYAALSIPILSAAAKVPFARPRVVFVPDDPRFGFYRQDFANTLCIFEEREPGGLGKNYSTEKLLEELQEDNDNRVDQEAVLKARLLDMFIMDFDRHEDQWRWSTIDTGKGKVYRPIPRDRDQAFFVSDGFIPSRIRKPWIFPKFQGFRVKAININTFNFNARYFDRSFLNDLQKESWEKQVDTLIMQMTDEVIEKALRAQPPEVFKHSGAEIIDKLKQRRNYLKQEALEYYGFLAKEVNVIGSDKKEFFNVKRNEDGSVNVDVYKITKEGEVSSKMYERKFIAKETREVRLYGMGGVDSFSISGAANNKIRIRIIGGSGEDIFENNSNGGKPIVYDLKSESNQFKETGDFKEKLSIYPAVNRVDRRTFKYNVFQPRLAFQYNRDDGLFIGAGMRYTLHGFRKEPFKIRHDLRATHALATSAYNFEYNLEAIDVVGKRDFLVNAQLKSPNNTINFFGYGNTSKFDNNGKNIRFYRTRYDMGEIAVMLRDPLTPDVTLVYGPTFRYFTIDKDDNKGRIISFPVKGIDTATVYKSKTFAGFQTGIIIDNRNDELIPTRGVNWRTYFKYNKGLGNFSNDYSQLTSDLSVYISSRTPATFVFALRFGGGINYGKYEFYQSQFLSGTENLRGFRKYRFAGDKMFYNNVEMRVRLKDFQTYLFPGSLGVLAFHDIGRVWVKGESSKVWHQGYGAGFWLAPASRLVLTVSYTLSKEEGLPLVSIGFQF